MKLAAIARALGCALDGDGDVDIDDVAAIDDARPGTLTFLADPKLTKHLRTTAASAIVLGADAPPVELPALRTSDPYAAFVAAIAIFHPPVRPAPGIHPTAVIATSARIGARASIGPHCVVGEGAVIGTDATLAPRVTIYADVRIGDDFTAHAGVTVREDVRIGDRVTRARGRGDRQRRVRVPAGARPARGRFPRWGWCHRGRRRDRCEHDRRPRDARRDGDRPRRQARQPGDGRRTTAASDRSRMLAAQVGLAGSTIVGAGVLMGGQVGAGGASHHRRRGPDRGTDRGPSRRPRGSHLSADIRRWRSGSWRRMAACRLRLPELFRRLRRVERRLGLDDPGEDA